MVSRMNKKGAGASGSGPSRLRSQEERGEAGPRGGEEPQPRQAGRSVVVSALAVLSDVEAFGLDFRADPQADRVLGDEERNGRTDRCPGHRETCGVELRRKLAADRVVGIAGAAEAGSVSEGHTDRADDPGDAVDP